MDIQQAAVIGAGTMGSQIAQVITNAGIRVRLIDLDQASVNRGLETIRRIYRGSVKKGKMTTGEMTGKLGLVSGATDYQGLGEVDIAIEAVFEEMETKRKILSAMDAACPPGTILASNTSSLSISALAATARRPGKVIGMHFFNPVYAMKLVEVIPGLATEEKTISDIVTFSERLGKRPIRTRECAGFVVNRLLIPYLNEAVFALQEGSATPNEIDDTIRTFGMPMGPFALLDVIGLDVAENVGRVLYDAYGPRLPVPFLLSELVKAGRVGKKAGIGIYRYDGKPDDDFPRILKKVRGGPERTTIPFRSERPVFLMINEAALCLHECIATADDIDLAVVLGTGFPKDKGGPLRYADQVGLDVVLEGLRRFADEMGQRFWPAPLLAQMVGAGYLGLKSEQGFFTY